MAGRWWSCRLGWIGVPEFRSGHAALPSFSHSPPADGPRSKTQRKPAKGKRARSRNGSALRSHPRRWLTDKVAAIWERRSCVFCSKPQGTVSLWLVSTKSDTRPPKEQTPAAPSAKNAKQRHSPDLLRNAFLLLLQQLPLPLQLLHKCQGGHTTRGVTTCDCRRKLIRRALIDRIADLTV
eukprot:1195245-Prorocentrum_minimum.AAC.1